MHIYIIFRIKVGYAIHKKLWKDKSFNAFFFEFTRFTLITLMIFIFLFS